MNKKGFTLAEILISLAIIGVIAAITIPALNSSNQYNTMVSKLASTVSTFENAMASMIVEEGANDLAGTQFASVISAQNPNLTNAAGVLGEYLKNNGISRQSLTVRNLNGAASTAIANIPTLIMKNGSWILFTNISVPPVSAASEATRVANGGNMFERFSQVTIDVNGSESPNIYGRDVFVYSLGTDGILYPVGGKDERVFSQGAFVDTINANCSSAGTGEFCAARLMLNGYKLDY